jgi:hypothetical protein
MGRTACYGVDARNIRGTAARKGLASCLRQAERVARLDICDAIQLPTTDCEVSPLGHVATKSLPPAEGQRIDKVADDTMRYVGGETGAFVLLDQV